MTSIDHALIEGYLVRTRWFGGKGRPFAVTRARVLADLSGDQDRPHVTVYLVTVEYADEAGGTELYQVPLAGYDDLEERISHAYVGALEADGHVRHVYDAVHDRDAMALWLDGFVAAEDAGHAEVGGLRFRRLPGEHVDADDSRRDQACDVSLEREWVHGGSNGGGRLVRVTAGGVGDAETA